MLLTSMDVHDMARIMIMTGRINSREGWGVGTSHSSMHLPAPGEVAAFIQQQLTSLQI
jgi:hypothetical protein